MGDKWSKDYGGDDGGEIDGGIGHGNRPELAFGRRLGCLVDVLRVSGWVDGTEWDRAPRLRSHGLGTKGCLEIGCKTSQSDESIRRGKLYLRSNSAAHVDVTIIFFTPPLMAVFAMLTVPWYAPY